MNRMALVFGILVLIAAFCAAQTKVIGTWVQYVDYDQEYENLLDALDSAPFSYELHEFWDYTVITAETLAQLDIFICPECEVSPGSSYDSIAGAFLGSILNPWVDAGGLLIGMHRYGRDFLNAAGYNFGGSYDHTTGDDVTVVLTGHPLTDGLPSTFEVPNYGYSYPNFGLFTPAVTYFYSSTEYMFVGFLESGVGCALFLGWDYWDTDTPNEDIIFHNAMSYWGYRSEGPILRSFFPPIDATVSADTHIAVVFQDEEGIDLSSFVATINGGLYTGSSAGVSLVGDTVFMDVLDTFPDGVVSLQIQNIEDVLSHEGPDTISTYSFYIDKSPPVIYFREPDGVYDYTPAGALVRYTDSLAGSDGDNWYMFFEYVDTIRSSSAGVIVEGDSTIIVPFSATGVVVTPGETTWVEFGIWDNPDIGDPNLEQYRWWFLDVTGISEDASLPEEFGISAYPNPFNSAVTISVGAVREPPVIEIFDIAGRRIDQIAVGEGLKPSRSSITTQTGGFETAPLRNCEFTWQPDKSIGSGIYLVRVKSGQSGESIVKRIVYLK